VNVVLFWHFFNDDSLRQGGAALPQELSWVNCVAISFLQILDDIVVLIALARKTLRVMEMGSQLLTKAVVVRLLERIEGILR
jgi:hypothetical protein